MLGYYGFDPSKRGSGFVVNKLICVQSVNHQSCKDGVSRQSLTPHLREAANCKCLICDAPKEKSWDMNVQGYLTYKKTHPPRTLP